MTNAGDAEFDGYAAGYDDALSRGLSLTGESKSYYAEHRIAWLARQAASAGMPRPQRVLDFGCGDGDAAPLLRDVLGAREVVGVDVSREMISIASRCHPWATFLPLDRLSEAGEFDAAYCNGVFHHIPLEARPAAARSVLDALRPGGLFGLWENNPWNPGTQIVMRRVAFDRDAVLLSPPETRRLLRGAGFRTLRTDHLFIFPAWLSSLRKLERPLSRLPIGGQYQVLGQRVA